MCFENSKLDINAEFFDKIFVKGLLQTKARQAVEGLPKARPRLRGPSVSGPRKGHTQGMDVLWEMFGQHKKVPQKRKNAKNILILV